MATDFKHDRSSDPPEAGPECCVCERHIDAAEAESLRAMLNVLNVKVADGYGAEFRAEAGETRLERIGHALEQLENSPGNVKGVMGPNNKRYVYNGLWHDLENIEAMLSEIADTISVCDEPGLCPEHGEDPDREYDRGR